MQTTDGGQRLYKSAGEMAAARTVKELLNNSWFKSRIGGKRIMEAKDVPALILNKETEARKSSKVGDGEQRRRDRSLRIRLQT